MAEFESHGLVGESKLLMDLSATNIDFPELGFEDENYDDQITEEIEKNEDEGWHDMSLRQKWESIMDRLNRKELFWDDTERESDDWDPNTRSLEPKEREALAGVDHLDNKTSPTVLHMLAKDFNDQKFHQLPINTRLKIVQYLLQHRKDNLASTQNAGIQQDPILTRALENENLEFIHFILENCKSSLPDLLEAKDIEGSNPLHYIFKSHLPEAIFHYLSAQRASKNGKTVRKKGLDLQNTIPILSHFISHAKPECVTARNNSLNTPIHFAFDYRICRMPISKYPEIMTHLVKTGDKIFKNNANREWQFNNKGESPYCYFLRTKDEYLATLRKPAQDPPANLVKLSATSPMAKHLEREMKPGTQEKKDTTRLSTKFEDSTKGGINTSLRDIKDLTGRGKRDAPRIPTESEMGSVPSKPAEEVRPDMKGPGRLQGQLKKPTNPIGGFSLTRSNTQEPSGTSAAMAVVRAKDLNHEVQASSPVVDRASKHLDSLPPLENLPISSQAGDSVSAKVHPATQVQNAAHGKQLSPRQGTAYKPAVEGEIFRTTAEKVRRLLQFHYIRERPDIEAKELLYGRVASDINLYFDATHLRGKSPEEVADLVQMLEKPGGFEDTLSYVKLPVLSYTAASSPGGSDSTTATYAANQTRQRDNDQEEKLMGRNSVVAVLDKLAQVGVRTILQLHVEEDSKTPPHTDAAIERAVRGQDSLIPTNKREKDGIAVETWNWRKFDLSTDVIGFATPKVTTVNLYWSGNQTVLRGWASNEGIPRLHASEGRLKRIVVHWSPGFEGVQRCEELLKNFKKEVEQATSVEYRDKSGFGTRKPGVIVTLQRLSSSKTTGSADKSLGPFTPGNPRAPPDHGWIESMETFRKALMVLHQGLPSDRKPDRIKVALIDDGIDRTNLHTYNNRVEVTGMSYLTHPAGMALQNPSWHQSTRGHGTVMANSIVRVNPWVFLYAMRIQDEIEVGPRNDASIRIHAGSAAKAIKDATIKKVDIISMSWTIRNIVKQDGHNRPHQGHETEEVEALKKAIDKAKKAGILMFCSASDDVQKKGVDMLPYSQAGDSGFRIGAADAYGWSDRATEDHRTIDWFFPGNQVADDFNPRSMRGAELQYRDGSSVATALAAGLASLIIYMANLMKAYSMPGSKNADKFSEYSSILRRKEAMRKAFDNIITDENYKDKKFLPVWDLFRTRAEKILEKTDDVVARWEVLDDLCRKLAT